MNEIQIVYDWLINHFRNSELVNTVTYVPTSQMDQNKENIYPLVNIHFLGKGTEEQVIPLTFKITVIQQRDTQPVKTDNKLMTDTNYLDNVNETGNVCTRFYNVLKMQNNDYNIDLQNMSIEKPLYNWGINNCDGFQFDCTLTVPNETTSC
jgi:hypothetical protein